MIENANIERSKKKTMFNKKKRYNGPISVGLATSVLSPFDRNFMVNWIKPAQNYQCSEPSDGWNWHKLCGSKPIYNDAWKLHTIDPKQNRTKPRTQKKKLVKNSQNMGAAHTTQFANNTDGPAITPRLNKQTNIPSSPMCQICISNSRNDDVDDE